MPISHNSVSVFKHFLSSGTNGATQPNTSGGNTRELNTSIYNILGITLGSNTLTFPTGGDYAIRVRCQHYGTAGVRAVHRLKVNGSFVGLASTPAICDGRSNWTSFSSNILTIPTSGALIITDHVSATSGSLKGKAFAQGNEVYMEVEIEGLSSSAFGVNGGYGLFYYSKSAGTNGDPEDDSYTGRTLSTQVNAITSLSVSTDTITFPPGNYRIKTLCTHFGIGSGYLFIHKFVDVSNPAISNANSNAISQTISYLNVPVGSTTDVQFKSRGNIDSSFGSLQGFPANLGEVEIYGLVEIVKLN